MRFVRRLLWTLLWVVVGCGFASAQHRTAPNGYYPPAYNGDVWVGRVEKVDSRTRSLTLVSVDKNRKKQTFVGVLEKGYLARHKSGRIEPLKVSEIPLGLKVTAFYEQRTKKANGKKVHYNVIITMVPIQNRKKQYKVFRPYGGPATH